ncbi:MAG TPA: SRPBCC family protein [Pyrinomonadaceae bacterium]|nr:SRPBCC family protein [Pyrinomonadaceae bacterium]
MIRNEIVAHFDRPVEEVFAYVDDDDKVKLWIGGLLETRRTTAGKPGVGSKFHQKLQIGKRVMELDGELLEYERNRRVRVKMNFHLGEMNATYNFTESGGCTELAYTCDSHYRSLFYRLLSPLIKRMAQQKLREDFARLQLLLQPR